MAAKEKTEKKKLGLSSQIFIALIGGAIVGVLIHYFMPEGYIRDTIIINGILYVIGQGFVRLLQMLVVPLVFCSLVCGSMAIGDTKTLGGVGVRIIIFYLCTTAIAVCVALSIASLINPGIGISLEAIETSEVTVAESTSFADTLLNIIPTNPINALAEGDMLPVIVFALFVGVMLAKLGSKASTVANFFSQFNDVMMEMTMSIMTIAPHRRVLHDRQDLRRHRLRRLPAHAEIHGVRHAGPYHPVLRRVYAAAGGFHPAEPHQVPEKVLPRADVRLHHRHL